MNAEVRGYDVEISDGKVVVKLPDNSVVEVYRSAQGRRSADLPMVERILQLHSSGRTIGQIVEETELADQTIKKYLMRAQVYPMPKRKKEPKEIDITEVRRKFLDSPLTHLLDFDMHIVDLGALESFIANPRAERIKTIRAFNNYGWRRLLNDFGGNLSPRNLRTYAEIISKNAGLGVLGVARITPEWKPHVKLEGNSQVV